MKIPETSVSLSLSYIDSITDELNRAVATATVSTYVNLVRREIADGTIPIMASPSQGAYRFTWAQSSTSITLTTSVQTNAWPGDFIECINFFEIGNERSLQKMDIVYFDQLLYSETYNAWDLATSGTPIVFIDRGATYDLYPAPLTALEFLLRYWAYPADLVEGVTDEVTMDTEIPYLVIAATCLKYARYLHDNDLIKHYKELTTEYYLAAMTKDKMRKWRGRQLKMKSYGDFDIAHWKSIHHVPEPQ
jgi:hypothetical protein